MMAQVVSTMAIINCVIPMIRMQEAEARGPAAFWGRPGRPGKWLSRVTQSWV